MSTIQESTQTFKSELITFKEFLTRVRFGKSDARLYSFNTMIKLIYQEGSQTEGNYIRRNTTLLRGSLEKIALHDLMAQASHQIHWKVPISEFYEIICAHQVENFGKAQFLVKLGSRRYAALDPEDFAVMEGKYGCTLVCYASMRLHVWELMPVTYEEALKPVHATHLKTDPTDQK